MIHEKNYLSEVKQNEILNMSKFVVAENFKHHTEEVVSTNRTSDIESVYKEEMDYLANSKAFAVRTDEGEIMGTIRVLRWDYITPMPIQKMFGINPLDCANGRAINEVWHIGRFAIKQGVRDIKLLKKLMVCAIAPVCEDSDNIAFAECDAKLLRIMTLMGIKAEIVGESIDYLGSETIPVCFPYAGLIDFYNENKHLVPAADSRPQMPAFKLPGSVVFKA